MFETTSKDTMPITNHMAVIEENTDDIAEFSFIINDSIIYHSLNDFRSATAKEKYLAWKKAEELYHTEQVQLVQLRMEYAETDENRRKELTPVILQLENNQSQLSKRCQNLLWEIRAAELND